VIPGHKAVTLTPVPDSSSERDSVRDSTYALVAAYVAREGTGWKAAMEATLRTRPKPRSTIGGTKAPSMAVNADRLRSIMS